MKYIETNLFGSQAVDSEIRFVPEDLGKMILKSLLTISRKYGATI
jgi:hypothetical protein